MPSSNRPETEDVQKKSAGPIKVALAGNPNCGKTTIFNALTGARQKVANYPGVTVESKFGTFTRSGKKYEIIDLPGAYSLTSFSPEEVIARRQILLAKPDVTVVVVDSTNLERNLYLLVQIMEIGANPVLCLNMSDEAKRSGQQIDVKHMEKLLGFPVVETIASKERGIDRLKVTITRAATKPLPPMRLVMGERFDKVLEHLQSMIDPTKFLTPPPPIQWMLIKLLESDTEVIAWMKKHLKDHEELFEQIELEKESISQETDMDPAVFVAHRRYGFISGLLREVRSTLPGMNARLMSDRIDEILCHKLFGFPVFLAAMYAVFWLTFTLGEYPMEWIGDGIVYLKSMIRSVWPDDHLLVRSLIHDGILSGVGGVLVFLPNILTLFFGLAFLEDTGYMARAAFLMDNILHRFGLHGKSFIPLITGFGCSVPGILATRILENKRDRLTTMLVLPLMSCGARLPIYALLIPAFFPEQYRTSMLWLIYIIGIVLAAGLAKLLRCSVLSGEDAPFVMELPPYRLPTFKAITMKMWDRGWIYLKKAGTVILGISVILWALSTFPQKTDFDVDRDIIAGAQLTESEIQGQRNAESLSYSSAGRIGSFIEPLIKPMGFDWKIGTALIGACAAKEVFVSQISIIFSMSESREDNEGLASILSKTYSPLIAFSLLIFLLIATPCMATVAVTRMESGRWAWAFLQFFGLTFMAFIFSTLIYQIGSLLGF